MKIISEIVTQLESIERAFELFIESEEGYKMDKEADLRRALGLIKAAATNLTKL